MPSLGAPDEDDPVLGPAPGNAARVNEPPGGPLAPAEISRAEAVAPVTPVGEPPTAGERTAEVPAANPSAATPPLAVETAVPTDDNKGLEAESAPIAPPPVENGVEAVPAVPPENGREEATPPAGDEPSVADPATRPAPVPHATLPVRRATHSAPLPVQTAAPAPARNRFALPALPTTGVAGLAVWAVRLALVAAGIGLGLMAQHTLDTARLTNQGVPPPAALQQWALGALLLALGAWPAPLLQTAVPAAARVLWGTNPRRRLAAGLGIAAALCGLGGLPLFAQINSPPDDIPITGGVANGAWALYLLSLLLGGLALIVWESGAKGGTPAWSADPMPDQLPRWIEVGVLVGLVALGLAFRIGNLDSAPPGLWYDEAQNGIVARGIVGLDAPHPVFIVARTQMGALYFYGLGLALAVTGTKIATLRLLPALAGALMAPLLYLLASRLYGWRAGLAAGGLITVAVWSITFSRIGLVTNVSVLLDLATLTFLVLALRSGRLGWYGLAGITFGLNLHMYYVARLMPLVIGLVLLHKLFSERGRFLRGIRFGVLVFAATALLAFLPMGLYALQHTTEFMGRVSDVSVFNPDANGGDPLAFQHSLEKHLWMFNWVGDGNSRHNLAGLPMLDSIIGALFVLGVGYCLLRVVRWQFFFPLAWFSVEILGGVLSLPFEAPQANRTAENMVTTVLFAGLVLGLGATALFRSRAVSAQPVPEPADDTRPASPPPAVVRPASQPGRARLLVRAGWVLSAGLVLAVVAQVGQTAQARYFTDQVNAVGTWREMYVPEMNVARIMQDYGGNYDIYVVPVLTGLPPQMFLAANSPAPLEYPGEWAIPLAEPMNRNIAFIIDPPTAGDFARLTRLYPNATFNILHTPNSSEPLQYTAFITKEDVQAIHGVQARFFAPDAPATAAPLSERTVPSINQSWGTNAGDPTPPFRVRYTATLRLPASGIFRFHLDGDPPDSRVQVDGYDLATPRLLGAGLHMLQVETVVRAANSQTRLVMSQDSGPEVDVLPDMLFKPSVEPHGLTGYYRRGNLFDGDAAKVRIDPVLSFYFHEVPLDRPYTVEWKGKLFIPQDGTYALGLEQISRATLEIDGKQVINNPNDNNYQEAQLQLTRGLHDIRVRFADLANYSHLYLYWTPPGHDQSIIPSYFFWPEMASYPDPNAGGTWPTLDDANGRVLPPQFANKGGTPPSAEPQGGTVPPAQPPAAPPAGQPPGEPPPTQPSATGLSLPPTAIIAPSRQIALDGQADPRGLATDAAGNLYVVTATDAKVHKFSPAGQEVTSWALVGKDGQPAAEPFSIAVRGQQVLVLDAATSDLLSYDLDGKPGTVVHACECFYARGLAVDSDGTLWVADTGGGRLVHLTAEAQPLGVIGQRGSQPGQFVEPTAVWRAADGRLYVADVGNSRVQVLSREGEYQAQWPILPGIARDGARLTGDAAGHIYVSFPDTGVVVYDAGGKPLATWQPANAPFRASALAIGGTTLYIGYPANAQVLGLPTLP
jgi:sugar lactone lactonase YvrE